MFESQHGNPSVPLVWRIALYAIDHHGRPLNRGELRRAVDPITRPAEISRAIAEAKRRKLISPDSSAGCLFSLLLDDEQAAS